MMDHIDGRIFRDPVAPQLDPAVRTAVYNAMAALHGVDWKAVGLEGFGKPS